MGDFTLSIIKCIHTCWQLDKNKCLYLPIIAPLQGPEGRSEISSAGLFSIWREALLRMDVCRLKQECRHRKETKSSASWHEPESLKCESPLGEKSKRLLFFKVCSSLNTHLQNNLFSNFAHFLSEKFLLFYNSLFCRYLFVPKSKLLGP